MSDENQTPAMPTIDAIHDRVVAERTVDAGSGRGGTSSDPSFDTALAAEDAAKAVHPKAEVKETSKDSPESREKVEKKPDPMASKFGALARKEKELRAKEEASARRIAEMEQREKMLAEKEERLQSAKSNPLSILKAHGFSYQDATEAVLGNYKEPELDPIDAKIKPYAEKFTASESKLAKLEAELEALRTERANEQHNASMNQIVKEIKTALDDDKFEITRTMGNEGIDFVRDIVVEYYKTHERLLDYTEACQIAEDYYEKEYLSKLLDTKKVKARLPSSAPQAKPAKQAKPTLTNDLATGSGATMDLDSMSKDEAIAYLAKKLQFN